jgi:peptide-methionine (S)-S-oxide reductase
MPLLPALSLTLSMACAGTPPAPPTDGAKAQTPAQTVGTPAAPPLEAGQAEAILAGGCFWCMEKPFDKVPGVISTTSGYTGGEPDHPTYQQVAMKMTTHYEAIRVVYDPTVVTYQRLLQVFWHNIDPTQDNGQFCDKGPQYRSAVFTDDPREREMAESSKAETQVRLGAPVVTEVLGASTFWVAEDYHQDFYVKSPERYTSYRRGCGRDRRLQELWGDAAGH